MQKSPKFSIALLFAFILILSPLAAATPPGTNVDLPAPGSVYDPDDTDAIPGTPLNIVYDDFVVYSVDLLGKKNLDLVDWPVAGLGTLDIVLMTHAPGASNTGVSVYDPTTTGIRTVDFEDPILTPSGSFSGPGQTLTDTWGAGGPLSHGPVLVDDVADYLQLQFGLGFGIPVFGFDMSESQRAAIEDLEMVADFRVIDPTKVDNPGTTEDERIVESWSIDAINNSAFDPAAYITVEGYQEIPNFYDPGNPFEIDNNDGSGSFDFAAFAPTMNLLNPLYYGKGYEFHIFGDFISLHGGGEEAAIIGGIKAPTGPNPQGTNVPEPGTMTLLGLAMLALGVKKFRSKK